jgi:sugar lactone lactonase YvrE
MVAYLHFIQPFARIRGQIRGILSPPEVAPRPERRSVSREPSPKLTLRDWRRALLFICGGVTEDRYWGEEWTTTERVLTDLTNWLRNTRSVRTLAVDEGWSPDRDVSVLISRLAWLDLRALVEEHGSGRSLLRVSMYLRPTSFGTLSAVSLATGLLIAASAGVALKWPTAAIIAAISTVAVAALVGWRTAQAAAVVHRGVQAIAARHRMVAIKPGPARVPLVAPSIVRAYALRTATVLMVMILALSASTFMLREAATGRVIVARGGSEAGAIQAALNNPGGIAVSSSGDVYFADSNNHVLLRVNARNQMNAVAGNSAEGAGFSGDFGKAVNAELNTPDGVAIAPDGDLVVADSQNSRIRRIDRETGMILTVAGTGRFEYNGDDKPALEASLNNPTGVAVAPNGDIYVADTLNYRIRMIDHVTGLIHTVAGDGSPGQDGGTVGDGGPATSAHLNMPSDVAVAPNGDVYIADMHHQRVRKVDAATRTITTVAGNGRWGNSGDDGPATDATLAGPAGIAVVPDGGGKVTIFIADYYNGRVRAVGPEGRIRAVSEGGVGAFQAPTRVAFSPRGGGWLYVADSTSDRVVALNIAKSAPNLIRARQTPSNATPPARKVSG